ncbi:dihydrofolate reductase [Propionibacteriaceae bacterium Y1685]|uniref:dihydrofolate reductase n=1 Tax=Microlunatus sp. Y1700 TaxID=3418487 RepID=UPI003B7B9460
MPQKVIMIAAVLENGVIGAEGDQPWSHPDDFAHFKDLTMRGVLIMGRKTYEAIGRPLPGRQTLVLTRDADFKPGDAPPDQARTVASLEEAFELTATEFADRKVWIAGGGEIYRQAMDRAERLEITHVHTELPGDVTFPEIDEAVWAEVGRTDRDEFSWVTYKRISAATPGSLESD